MVKSYLAVFNAQEYGGVSVEDFRQRLLQELKERALPEYEAWEQSDRSEISSHFAELIDAELQLIGKVSYLPAPAPTFL